MCVDVELENRLLSIISEKQQVSLNELAQQYSGNGISKDTISEALSDLEKKGLIISRSNGGILTYYILESDALKKVLIVEDDKNINRLMKLSIGTGFDVYQIYDGGEVMGYVRANHPDLVILDLMLPHKDGLDICHTIKEDPELKNTIVILVSAMDPSSNRFRGIRYGADYYIKKPFDPQELKALVSIFLRKKGRRFDPLIDLPDEERLSKEFEYSIKAGNEYAIGTLSIDNLSAYAKQVGEKSAMTLLRLISQLLQDAISKGNKAAPELFVGFLNSTQFVAAGPKKALYDAINEVKKEFEAVLPFILQDAGYKQMPGIEPIFDSDELPKLSLSFTESSKDDMILRRDEVLKSKTKNAGASPESIGTYTYEELEKMFGADNLDIRITRDANGIKLSIGKPDYDEGNEAK